MPTITLTYETEAERGASQRAIDHAAEMLRVAQVVPDAQVVDACEGAGLGPRPQAPPRLAGRRHPEPH